MPHPRLRRTDARGGHRPVTDDWASGGAEERAAALFKEMLLAHVRAYALGLPGIITQYDDGPMPIVPGEAFASLLRRSPFLALPHSELPAHLTAPSSHLFPEGEDFLYWSKEQFGLAPFITVTHVTIAPASGHIVIASRDVYSSRYLDASLSVTISADVPGNAQASYLVYVNRSIATALKGVFAGLRRSIVQRRIRAGVEKNLALVKQRLEQP